MLESHAEENLDTIEQGVMMKIAADPGWMVIAFDCFCLTTAEHYERPIPHAEQIYDQTQFNSNRCKHAIPAVEFSKHSRKFQRRITGESFVRVHFADANQKRCLH